MSRIHLVTLGLAALALTALARPRAAPAAPVALGQQISQTRAARIRQLMLEAEEGKSDAQGKSDGEDEQQGGIESVQWGPGWGPAMDEAFGSKVVNERALDAFQPPEGKAALSEFDREVQDDAQEATHYEKQIGKEEMQIDADERAAGRQFRAAQHRRAQRKGAGGSQRNTHEPRASQGSPRR
jgi:hypothetical protein